MASVKLILNRHRALKSGMSAGSGAPQLAQKATPFGLLAPHLGQFIKLLLHFS